MGSDLTNWNTRAVDVYWLIARVPTVELCAGLCLCFCFFPYFTICILFFPSDRSAIAPVYLFQFCHFSSEIVLLHNSLAFRRIIIAVYSCFFACFLELYNIVTSFSISNKTTICGICFWKPTTILTVLSKEQQARTETNKCRFSGPNTIYAHTERTRTKLSRSKLYDVDYYDLFQFCTLISAFARSMCINTVLTIYSLRNWHTKQQLVYIFLNHKFFNRCSRVHLAQWLQKNIGSVSMIWFRSVLFHKICCAQSGKLKSNKPESTPWVFQRVFNRTPQSIDGQPVNWVGAQCLNV